MNEPILFSVSDFVASVNQTFEFAYGVVAVQGELSNFRVSKNKWVYFDLKDEHSSVRCFGTVYQLPGPLEDGMVVQIQATPRLHPQFGFSLNVTATIQPAGEGSIKKAAALLEAKLQNEGLFDESRKRPLPFPPKRIGLVTSAESAAYADFIKILSERWVGVDVDVYDVQVQGEVAIEHIVQAVQYFNSAPDLPDVLVVTRGGGSIDDLAVFSTEQVTRVIASSRIPTLVAIGHEIDFSLAELAADKRASTPSNAAQLLTPDKRHVIPMLEQNKVVLAHGLAGVLQTMRSLMRIQQSELLSSMAHMLQAHRHNLQATRALLQALNPKAVLDRGFAIVRKSGQLVSTGRILNTGDSVTIEFKDATINAEVQD